MQLQNKHSSTPLHVHTTCNPQAKFLKYVKGTRSNTYLWNKIKIKGVALATKYIYT